MVHIGPGWFWLLMDTWLVLEGPCCFWLVLVGPGLSWLVLFGPGYWEVLVDPVVSGCFWLVLVGLG